MHTKKKKKLIVKFDLVHHVSCIGHWKILFILREGHSCNVQLYLRMLSQRLERVYGIIKWLCDRSTLQVYIIVRAPFT